MITKILQRIFIQFWIIVVVLVGLGAIFVVVAHASPPAQDPRPPVDSGGGGSGKGRGDGDSVPQIRCGAVSGQVINWGYRPEPGITTDLKTGSWQVSDVSATDGSYGFGGLGIGVAKLNVALAPSDPLQSFIKDAVIYLNCDFPTIANVAIFTGPRIDPPATLRITAPSDVVTWNDSTNMTLTVQNNLPNDITNVIVTDLMPPGLIALAASTSATAEEANTRLIDGGDDGQLVVAYLNTVAAGAEEQVTITVRAIEDTPHTQLKNTATLFYRESVADQTSIDFTVGRDRATAPAAVGAEVASSSVSTENVIDREVEATLETNPVAQTAPAVPPTKPEASGATSTTTSATPTPSTFTTEDKVQSEEFSPPDTLLPVTGGNASFHKNTIKTAPTSSLETDASVLGPLNRLVLVGIVLGVYILRSLVRGAE